MPEITNSTNRLLAALPAEEYARHFPKLTEVFLNYAETLYEAGDVIRQVYFPESGIVSLLTSVGENSLLEVGIVGSEGFIGLPFFLGVETSNTRVVVQGAGKALVMNTADFTAWCELGGEMPRLLRRYTHSLMSQISQSAACNRFHPVEARLARWLLMIADRMASNEFRITQELLSNMLGVRRESVNKSATAFQQNGWIKYSRGKLSIIDRRELEAAACQCYFIMQEEYKNLFKKPDRVLSRQNIEQPPTD